MNEPCVLAFVSHKVRDRNTRREPSGLPAHGSEPECNVQVYVRGDAPASVTTHDRTTAIAAVVHRENGPVAVRGLLQSSSFPVRVCCEGLFSVTTETVHFRCLWQGVIFVAHGDGSLCVRSTGTTTYFRCTQWRLTSMRTARAILRFRR